MGGLILVTGAILLFAVTGVVKHGNTRLKRHGIHALTWRFLSGEAWHGRAVTNRGWKRPGSGKALTPTGHARWTYFLPRWQHALIRSGCTALVLAAGCGLLLATTVTLACLAAAGAAGCGYGCTRAWRLVRTWAHRKNYVKPAHARIAPLVGVPLPMRPESWLQIPRDRKSAVLTLPKGALVPSPKEQEAIEYAAKSTLGMAAAEATWEKPGPRMRLRLTVPPPLPELVTLDDIRQALLDAGMDDLILGIGPRPGLISHASLSLDSPHLGLSMETGAGKSVCIRCVLPQVLFRGGIGLVLDNKRVSHPWARDLPNVAYCSGIAKIHQALVWLDGELDSRAAFVEANTDTDGRLTGCPGPRIMVTLEEVNLLRNRLDAYWNECRAEDRSLPPVSPARRGLENVTYAGRELLVNAVFIGQRLSARATSNADVRLNIGTRLLARYDRATWDMLVGRDVPMPKPSRLRGRIQKVVAGDVTETQVAFLTHAQARQMALGGLVAELPADMPRSPLPRAARALPGGRPAGGMPRPAAPQPAPPGPALNAVSVAEAIRDGLVPWKTSAAFRTAKHRASRRGMDLPRVIGLRGAEKLYDAVQLADWAELIKPGG